MANESDDDPVDSSHLTDADWAELNKLRQAYKTGGQRALSKAMVELRKDPVRYIRVTGAYLPNEVREALKDGMAEAGMTMEDLRELGRKLESPAGKQ
jgi:hypothetical protein